MRFHTDFAPKVSQSRSHLYSLSVFFSLNFPKFFSYDQTEPDNLRREYYHYLGDSETKNDQYFVIQSWKAMIADGVIKDGERMMVWSDGGPKHYKVSNVMW